MLALALTASGCQAAAGTGGPPAAPTPEAAPKTKIADAPVIVDPAFRPNNLVTEKWFTEAEEAEIRNTSIAALKVMIEDHPEYTVEGFTPSLELWNAEIAPKLQPLFVPADWKDTTDAWTRPQTGEIRLEGAAAEQFRGNAILTNRPEILNSRTSGYELTNTWKSDKGETCSPSEKPYEYDVKGVSLDSQMAQDSTLYPIVSAQMDVFVHCKEGGTLKTRMNQNLALKRSEGQFLIAAAGLMKTGNGSSVIEK